MKLIAQEQYDKLVKSGQKYIKAHDNGKSESIEPILTIVLRNRSGEEDYEHIAVVFEELDDQKQEMFYAIGQKAVREMPDYAPVCASFMSEAWAAKLDKGKQIKGRVRDQKGKREIAMLAVMQVSGESEVWQAEITRTSKNKMVLGKMEHFEDVDLNLLKAFFTGVADEVLS